MPTGRPFFDPTLPLLWRSPRTLQVGLDPRHARALVEVPPSAPRLLRLLSEASGWDVMRYQARAEGCAPAMQRLVDLLAAAGLLADGPPADHWSSSWVEVVGTERLGSTIAQGLRSAGVRCTLAEAPTLAGPDVVVVAPDAGRGMAVHDPLVASGQRHLWVHLRDGRAVVGPMVRPGSSSCLRCLDLHRSDCDPAWPRLALAWERAPAAGATGPAYHLASAVAARQVLLALAGRPVATADGTLEEQPDGHLVREHWRPHPGCGCAWTASTDPRCAADGSQQALG